MYIFSRILINELFKQFLKTFSYPVQCQVLLADKEQEEEVEEKQEEEEGVSDRYVRSFK